MALIIVNNFSPLNQKKISYFLLHSIMKAVCSLFVCQPLSHGSLLHPQCIDKDGEAILVWNDTLHLLHHA
jgi:hypothetical protein